VDAPLIGITTSELRSKEDVRRTRHGEPPHAEMSLGLGYIKAVSAAGGIPVVLPPLEVVALEPLLDRFGGICLSGGPDLDPSNTGPTATASSAPRSPRPTASRSSWRDLPGRAIYRCWRSAAAARRSMSRAAGRSFSTFPSSRR